MSIDEPKSKRLCLSPPKSRDGASPVTSRDGNLQQHIQIEEHYPRKCLCGLQDPDLNIYVTQNLSNLSKCDTSLPEKSSCLLFLGFITWLCETFHDQLSSGFVCSKIRAVASFLLEQDEDLKALIDLLKSEDDTVQFSTVQALTALLPLCHCGLETNSSFSSVFIERMLEDVLDDKEEHRSLLDSVAPGEVACLDDFFFGEAAPGPSAPRPEVAPSPAPSSLGYKCQLVAVLAGFVTHTDKPREDGAAEAAAGCSREELGEDVLCQETEVKMMVLKMMDPVWPRFTRHLAATLADTATAASFLGEVYLVHGFRLWQSLISVRANLSFVKSRAFSADLSSSLAQLTSAAPASVWRAVLDTVSECLCYGTTLALQSVPPGEPCELAHTLIRMVRFNKFLSQVPYRQSLGMGGSAALGGSCGGSEEYDKGLVQKMVLTILKCVALTTREARVDSSSGESDSSASSRESVSSGGSDMVIIERTMAGMYRNLDTWIKDILPVLPDQSLQESLLHILQEQDDVLVEGLLCLLDTHAALYIPGKREPETALLDTNPSRGFLQLVNIVSRDSSVLLDFLVSNETCFLLYFLRFLKFVTKDWTGFVTTCGSQYSEVVEVLLDLKLSINRLMSKALFPYNIGPVYRLLDKVSTLHADTVKP